MIKMYKGVISPDYSLYYNMPLNMQKYNTYRGKALAHWLIENGVEVIPNYLHKIITHGTIIKEEIKTIGNKTGYERDYYYNRKYFVVTGIGTNGFLVSAYPKKYKGE